MQDKEVIYAKWLNGEISDEEFAAVEGDMAVTELSHVIDTMDKWSMPNYDTTKGFQKFSQVRKGKSEKKKFAKWIFIITLITLLAILGWFLLSDKNKILQAQPGENLNFALKDGSEIWLNDGSAVAYNSANWDEARIIELTGEALFEVRKGSPFVVKTDQGTVTVLGTKFNVRAWGENFYVSCYEGKVRVESNGQEVILSAQESVSVISNKMEDKRVIADNGPSWQNGTSRFTDEKLLTVCEEIERQYGVKVDLRATDRIFSGSFDHDDVGTALSRVCKPLGLTFEISEDKKAVVIE